MWKGLRHRLLNVLGKKEARRLSKESEIGENTLPPVFIVGAPRTGSTFLYQLLTSGGHFFYFNNFIIDRYQIAFRASKDYYKRFGNFRHDSFNSDLGSTEGIHAPNEAGYFWYRWFPQGIHELDADELPAESKQQIRAYFHAFDQEFGLPMIHKNLNASLRMRPLHEIAPNALFIHIGRDALENARSIYRGRIRQGGEANYWLSLKPKNYPTLRQLDVPDQIVGQIHTINRRIIEDASLYGEERRIFIRYEDLMEDTQTVLERIAQFLSTFDISVQGLESLSGRALNPESKPLDEAVEKGLISAIEAQLKLVTGPEELYLKSEKQSPQND